MLRPLAMFLPAALCFALAMLPSVRYRRAGRVRVPFRRVRA